MVNLHILASSWKRHYEQHPLKNQSNAKLADIATIFGHNKSSNDGVAEFCNIDNLFGLGCYYHHHYQHQHYHHRPWLN
jgi:hypothetical protein